MSIIYEKPKYLSILEEVEDVLLREGIIMSQYEKLKLERKKHKLQLKSQQSTSNIYNTIKHYIISIIDGISL